MAGRYPASFLDELRARADIVQIVSGYVSLKKNGRNYWGLCPFHGEKTASFSVSPEKQIYYCFGCKAGGSVISFIMEMERLSFSEAVQHLAEQVHLPLPEMERDAEWEQKRNRRERYLNANLEAARFYHETLFTPAGAACLRYLKERGLSDGVIRKFGLGASPADGDALVRLLTAKGYTREELVRCGLARVYEAKDGKPERTVDFFRNRPMFPIIDQYGNVLGFGGRSLDGAPPKYMNTSDSPVFNKRMGVFAANLLRKERHLERIILVEGYMDVVSLTQFGVTGVCATLGTALTNEQARLLKRFAPAVYLAYDGDSAGQHAILRGLEILEQEGVPARVLDFPDGLDPDEFIRRDGPEGFAGLPAITPTAYRMRRLKEQYDLSSQEGRTAYAKEAAKLLTALEPVDREVHLRELMLATGFTREILEAQIGLTPVRKEEEAPAKEPRPALQTPPQDELHRAQEMLLALTASGQLPRDSLSEEDFPEEELKQIFLELKAGTGIVELIDRSEDPQTRSRLTAILELQIAESTDGILAMAQDCMNTVKRITVENRREALMQQLKQHADPAVLREIQELQKQLMHLKGRR